MTINFVLSLYSVSHTRVSSTQYHMHLRLIHTIQNILYAGCNDSQMHVCIWQEQHHLGLISYCWECSWSSALLSFSRFTVQKIASQCMITPFILASENIKPFPYKALPDISCQPSKDLWIIWSMNSTKH